jgi:hypothetical protein
MKNYRVWSRVSAIDGTGRYLCVVVAIPEQHGEDEPSESESRVLMSHDVAREAGAGMALAMADRIRRRGDKVTVIESA